MKKTYEKQLKTLKQGEIFFAPINALSSVGILDLEIDNFNSSIDYDKSIQVLSRCVDGETYNYLEKLDNKLDMLIALKYLGNGIFEEMLTGEKIINVHDTVTFKTNDGFEVLHLSDYDVSSNKDLIVNYEDYVCVEQERVLSKLEYSTLLQEFMQKSFDYPLSYVGNDCMNYYVVENSKKRYLEYSDEDRKKVMTELKNKALLDTKNTNEKVVEAIEKMKDTDMILNDDILNMAYLDNQLYDFENKGRSK